MRASVILACGVVVGFLGASLHGWLSVSRADLAKSAPKFKTQPTSAENNAPVSDDSTSNAPFFSSLAERQIREALDQPMSFELRETPLHVAIETLAKKSRQNIVLDVEGLAAANIESDHQVTLTVHDVKLRQALYQLLIPLGLTFRIRYESIVVTDIDDSAGRLVSKVYPVADLVYLDAPDGARIIAGNTMELLQNAVEADSWNKHGGTGSIEFEPVSGSFVIMQSEKVHAEILRLLDNLRASMGRLAQIEGAREKLHAAYVADLKRYEEVDGRSLALLRLLGLSIEAEPTRPGMQIAPDYMADDSLIEPIVERSSMEREIEKSLDQLVSLKFENTPLNEAVETLAKKTGVKMALDEQGLLIAQVERTEPVTLVLRDVKLRHGLRRLLSPLYLTFQVRDNAIFIVDMQETGSALVTRVYPVADLVFIEGQDGGRLIAEEMMKLLQDSVASDTWDRDGGTGTIGFAPVSCSFVVTQQESVHDLVEELLTGLREAGRRLPKLSPRHEEVHAAYVKWLTATERAKAAREMQRIKSGAPEPVKKELRGLGSHEIPPEVREEKARVSRDEGLARLVNALADLAELHLKRETDKRPPEHKQPPNP